MCDTLAKATGEALLDWLQSYYGRSLAKLTKQTPIWVSLAKGPSHGQKLGIQAIADVCQNTWAPPRSIPCVTPLRIAWRPLGLVSAPSRRGSETSAYPRACRYLAQLRQAENYYAETLASVLGIE